MATTVPESAWGLLRGQLAHLREVGHEVLLVSSPGPLLEDVGAREGVRVRGVPMSREISPWADLRSLVRLVRVVREEKPDVTVTGTPKAGLLVGLAAWACRVPTRVYLLRGLRLETEQGARRWVGLTAERIAARVAHEVVCVSPSLLAEARSLGVLAHDAGVVIGRGGSNGVPRSALHPVAGAPSAARARWGIDDSEIVFGFVGRITRDKGVRELLAAFDMVSAQRPDVSLLVAGNIEPAGISPALLTTLRSHDRIRYVGWLDDPRDVYLAADVFVLPTYREGLPTVCLEASAAGRPVVTTGATGARDVVDHEVTGLIVPVGDAPALAAAMIRLAENPELRRRMGAAGRALVEADYVNEVVWAGLDRFLDRLQHRRDDHPRDGRRTVVAHVFGAMDRGGAELRTRDLVRRAPDVDHVFVTLSGRRGALADELEGDGAAVVPVPLHSTTFPLRFIKAMRAAQVDVLHTNVSTFSGVLVALGATAGVRRRIVHFRSDGDGHHDSPRRRLQRAAMRRLIRWFATDVIAVSPSALAFGAGARETTGDPRWRVIPNGVEPDPDQPGLDSDPVVTLAADHARRGDVLMAHVGRSLASKNRPRAVDLAARTLDAVPALRLLVVGELDRGEADSLTAGLPLRVRTRIEAVGPTEDVPGLLRHCAVLLVTSSREGLPGVVLEALSVGTPVVSTALPGAVWISTLVAGVTVLPEEAPDSDWVRAISAAASASQANRRAVRDSFAAGPFTLDSSARAFRELWTEHARPTTRGQTPAHQCPPPTDT